MASLLSHERSVQPEIELERMKPSHLLPHEAVRQKMWDPF